MRLFLLLCCVSFISCQSGDEDTTTCPTLAGGLDSFEPELDIHIESNVSNDRVDLILNGSLVFSDGPLTPLLPQGLSLQLISREQPLYTAISVWTLDGITPSGCSSPVQANLSPGNATVVNVNLTCNTAESVSVLLCITVGTQPFSFLNGSYITYDVSLTTSCEALTVGQCPVGLRSQDLAVPVEFCATRNQIRDLAMFGANSWSILVSSFGRNEDERGYCLVDADLGGVNPVFSIDATSSRDLPIPEAFPGLDLYLENRLATSTMFSYSFGVEVENSSVLADPFIAPPQLSQGVATGRHFIHVDMPCLKPGFTSVTVFLNTSGFINEIIYRRDLSLLFYRNCTPDPNSTLVLVNSDGNLGLQVGLPLTLILVTIATIVVVIVIVLVQLTRRHKLKRYAISQQVELDLLRSCNAYVRSNLDPFQFLDEYNIEYNYASLEVVGSLGEGAFGRVYKARAPGIQREGYVHQEFVAVKTLKEGSGEDLLEAFRSEVRVCVKFKHQNVIRLVGVCSKGTQKCMIFEYMDLGGLGDLLRHSDPNSAEYRGPDSLLLTPELFLPTVTQVAAGLEYLASLKFVHRDMATRNCLVDHNFNVKIADFGMSRQTNAMDYYRIGSAKAYLPVRWMPPEALLYGKFTVKSDVWSFGVLMWEVFSYGRQPYSGLSNYEVIDRVKSGQILDCPDLCTPPVYDILRSTWTRAPSKRPSMSTVGDRLRQLLRNGQEGSEGYLNMAFGTLPSQEELEEKRRVDANLETHNTVEASDPNP